MPETQKLCRKKLSKFIQTNALVQSAPESAKRRNALASLENIGREINQRYSDQRERDAGL